MTCHMTPTYKATMSFERERAREKTDQYLKQRSVLRVRSELYKGECQRNVGL